MKTVLPSLARRVGLFLATLASLQAASDYSRPYSFTTLAGVASIGSEDGAGASARFFSPRAAAVDATGNAFIVDTGNHVIRKVTPTGTVSTFAGVAGVPGSADGTGADARFNSPQDIAADAAGNLFVTDTANQTIRKITPAGVVTTVAGSAGVAGHIDGTGSAARFNQPLGLALDATGNLFVTEGGNGAIRKITPAGVVSTYARDLHFSEPDYCAIAVDSAGSVYVALFAFRNEDYTFDEQGNPIRHASDIGFLTKVLPDGTLNYLTQTTRTLSPPAEVGPSSTITDLLASGVDKLIVAGSRQVRTFSVTDRSFSALSGSGQGGSSDGNATDAHYSDQFGLAALPNGGFIVADAGNNTVRRIAVTGSVNTIAGLALDNAVGTRDGAGAAARFAGAAGMAIDASGNLYLADTDAHCIRKISAGSVVTTLAGSPGNAGADDGAGANARFNRPTGVAMAPSGDLYVADTFNHAIRRVSAGGMVTTVAGKAGSHANDPSSVFAFPQGVAVNAAGAVLVADTHNSSIRLVAGDGSVQTLYGLTGESGTADGTGGSARFTRPTGIAVAPGGDLYVTEASETPSVSRIRHIATNGTVTTIAGAENGYADGAAPRFNRPAAIAVDADGNLFVADTYNHVVRAVSPTGAARTLGGLAGAPGNSDGTGGGARFFYPEGAAVSGNKLYITSSTAVRQGSLAPLPTITTQPASQSVKAGGSVTFTVAATSPSSLRYQWFFNGTALAGATSASFGLNNVQVGNAGDYTVTVTNDGGSATSNVAKLTVETTTNPPPTGGGGGSTGGGGAPSFWFVGFLGLLAAFRSLRICLRRAG